MIRSTDLEPLIKRYPGLGQPLSATWYNGRINTNDGFLPSPGSYFLDAVIELDPEVATRLRELPGLAPEPIPYSLMPELNDVIPQNCIWLGNSKSKLPSDKDVIAADLEQTQEINVDRLIHGVVVGQDCDFVIIECGSKK